MSGRWWTETECLVFRPDDTPAWITNSRAGVRITNATPGKVYAMLDSLRRRGALGNITPFGRHEDTATQPDTPSRVGGGHCPRPECEYHHTRNMLYRPKHRAENGQPSDLSVLESFGFNVEVGEA